MLFLLQSNKKYIAFSEYNVSFNKELSNFNKKYADASGNNPIIEPIKDDVTGLTTVGEVSTYDCFLMGDEPDIQAVVLYQKETDIDSDTNTKDDYRQVQLIYKTTESTYPFILSASVPWNYKDTFSSLLEELKAILNNISTPTDDAYKQENPEPTMNVDILNEFVKSQIDGSKQHEKNQY